MSGAPPFPNIYHLRTVADTASKACFVCHKATVKVLITPNNKDFFYTCASHLSDRGFASPVVDAEAEAAKKKKEMMEKEIAKVKAEYEEKMKNKKNKKSKDEDKDKKKDDNDADKAEKERDDKIKGIQEAAAASNDGPDDAPRIYNLQKNFYQMRLDRLRQQEQAKRNAARFKDPNLFPSTPKGDIA